MRIDANLHRAGPSPRSQRHRRGSGRRGADQVRDGQGGGHARRRSVSLHGDALPGKLRLHPAHPLRRRRPLRRPQSPTSAASYLARSSRCAPSACSRCRTRRAATRRSSPCPSRASRSATRRIESYTDLPDITLKQIEHFFEHYKDLEPGKWVRVIGWGGAEEAERLIVEAIDRVRLNIPASRRSSSTLLAAVTSSVVPIPPKPPKA